MITDRKIFKKYESIKLHTNKAVLNAIQSSSHQCQIEKAVISAESSAEPSLNVCIPIFNVGKCRSVTSSEVIQYTKKLLGLNIADLPPFEKEDHPEKGGVSDSCLEVGFMTRSRIGTNSNIHPGVIFC